MDDALRRDIQMSRYYLTVVGVQCAYWLPWPKVSVTAEIPDQLCQSSNWTKVTWQGQLITTGQISQWTDGSLSVNQIKLIWPIILGLLTKHLGVCPTSFFSLGFVGNGDEGPIRADVFFTFWRYKTVLHENPKVCDELICLSAFADVSYLFSGWSITVSNIFHLNPFVILQSASNMKSIGYSAQQIGQPLTLSTNRAEKMNANIVGIIVIRLENEFITCGNLLIYQHLAIKREDSKKK